MIKNGKRVTIVIDSEIDKQVRNIQANMIKKSAKSVSFSKVINKLLGKALK